MTQGVDAVKARCGRKAPVPSELSATVRVDPSGCGDVRTIAEAVQLLPVEGGVILLSPDAIHPINASITLRAGGVYVFKSDRRDIFRSPYKASILIGSTIAAFLSSGSSKVYIEFHNIIIRGGGDAATSKIFNGVPSSGSVSLSFWNCELPGSTESIETLIQSNATNNILNLYERTQITVAYAANGRYFYSPANTGSVVITLLDASTLVGSVPGGRNIQTTLANGCRIVCHSGSFISLGLNEPTFLEVWLYDSELASYAGDAQINVTRLIAHNSTINACWFNLTGLGQPQFVDDCRFTSNGTINYGIVVNGTDKLYLDNTYAPYSDFVLGLFSKAAGARVILNDLGILAVVAGSTPLTTDDTVILANAVGGAVTVTLPIASRMNSRTVTVKKIDLTANTVSVTPNGANLLEGVNAPLVLSSPNEEVRIVSNGTAWYVIG